MMTTSERYYVAIGLRADTRVYNSYPHFSNTSPLYLPIIVLLVRFKDTQNLDSVCTSILRNVDLLATSCLNVAGIFLNSEAARGALKPKVKGFYTAAHGHHIGIWHVCKNDCNKEVNKYPSAHHKKFIHFNEAMEWLITDGHRLGFGTQLSLGEEPNTRSASSPFPQPSKNKGKGKATEASPRPSSEFFSPIAIESVHISDESPQPKGPPPSLSHCTHGPVQVSSTSVHAQPSFSHSPTPPHLIPPYHAPNSTRVHHVSVLRGPEMAWRMLTAVPAHNMAPIFQHIRKLDGIHQSLTIPAESDDMPILSFGPMADIDLHLHGFSLRALLRI
ncbi:hypothetical protein CONPUDRAFT_157911 [Coniophora puteana RWD-64-598 SS2]|uniref:Ribonuclease H1 N-terminal domain-containing protein n=1 Tax=Coniophora puteana (strain RWD-64-598) TaxID=741705 RepID=A0A5M3MD22_CONPW|nr:uncharacterized protein CONPUDRAFT_157911 [Coniophora puteana RWD-64-598 SS2]EIW76740.1 hypothetical protein CONPUDRAFT_157911 [Coniophora puteana RWD-64-598 SS2]